MIAPSLDTVAGKEALSTAKGNAARRYPNRSDQRYDDFLIFPALRSGFKIPAESSVFTIGSCFARNVEEALVEHGVKVPTASYDAAQDNVPGRPNRVLNQYNPGTMFQAVENAFGTPTEGGIYRVSLTGRVVDCLLSTGNKSVSASRAKERREEITQLYKDGLAASDTVVITLGLIETWIDREADLYLNEAPPMKLLMKDKGRFAFCRLGVAECDKLVSGMIERLNADKPRNIVLTVSPVPLQATFTEVDAVTANGYSKGVLRVVAEAVAQNFANVDYFPSYEAVTTSGFRSLGEDNVHVRPKVVGRVVDYMLNEYLEGVSVD